MQRWHTLAAHYNHKYGCRVQKIPLDAGACCPNRDGTLSSDGCIFCNANGSGSGRAKRGDSLLQQWNALRAVYLRDDPNTRFIAYLQSFSNTYGPQKRLQQLLQSVRSMPQCFGVAVGTRPDCLDGPKLDTLAALNCDLWLELGLQTAHDKTLHRINRGHDFACYQQTTRLARERGLKVCSHLIVGLPGEGQGECLETLKQVVETGVDGIKLHPLHIVKGSTMAKAWEAGRLNGIELDDYTVTAGEMIRHTPPEVIYHRISASARRPTLLAPLWCENRWTGMVELDRYLNEQGAQGSALGRSWVAPQSAK